ncbi:MAG TPA: thermonuclease family protein [Rubrobacter sp.]|nr:thermonuclease family protein [Rubrobacter sp.]
MKGRVLAAVALILAACSNPEPPVAEPEVRTSTAPVTVREEPEESPSESPSEATWTQDSPRNLAMVTRVIDGDTVEAVLDDQILDVRLIGIDTPETVHPSEPVGCYGPAASSFTTRMLEGQVVELEFDVERVDRYGRTLAYVWLDEQLFNETLLSRGFAQVSTFPPNVKYVDRFLAAQREARANERGLWGPRCDVEDAGGGGGAGGGSGGGGNCDPSYPDVCIPAYPPDLDCGEVAFTNFRVEGPDPHGFDGDSDGVGCET